MERAAALLPVRQRLPGGLGAAGPCLLQTRPDVDHDGRFLRRQLALEPRQPGQLDLQVPQRAQRGLEASKLAVRPARGLPLAKQPHRTAETAQRHPDVVDALRAEPLAKRRTMLLDVRQTRGEKSRRRVDEAGGGPKASHRAGSGHACPRRLAGVQGEPQVSAQ